MAWTVVCDDTFTHADTSAGGAGTTTGVPTTGGTSDPWTDVAGSIYQIASNDLVGTVSGLSASRLVRPVGEAELDTRIVWTMPGQAATSQPIGCLRRQSNNNCYALGWYGGTAYLWEYSSANYNAITSAAISGFDAAHEYQIDFAATGASPTTIAITVTDLTTSATAATINTTDSTGPQVAGVPGVTASAYGGTGVAVTYSRVTTYRQTTPETITIDDAGLFYSPYNWWFSGSDYAQTNNPGAYLRTQFSGTSAALTVDTSINAALSAGEYPAVAWSIDDGEWQRAQLSSGQTSLTLANGLDSGTHTLAVYVVGAWWQGERWTSPASAVRITGLELDEGESLTAPTLATGRAVWFWDSNGEGYEALEDGVSVANQDARIASPQIVAEALGCEIGVVAFAGQGYSATGGGNVPACNSAWDDMDSAHSRLVDSLFDPAPDYIFIAHGENDGSLSEGTVTTLLGALRTAAPAAKIAVCSPANLANAATLAAAVTAFDDSACKWVTTGENLLTGSYGNTYHLTALGHERYASLLLAALEAAFPAAPEPAEDAPEPGAEGWTPLMEWVPGPTDDELVEFVREVYGAD